MEQANGVFIRIIRTETVRTDHFGKTITLMRIGGEPGAAHFGQAHFDAPLCQLPSRFAACQTAADYVNLIILLQRRFSL